MSTAKLRSPLVAIYGDFLMATDMPCRPGRRAVPRLPRAAMITRGRLPGRRPRTGQAAAHFANTSRNGRERGPVLCYSRWVNITELVIFHRSGGSSPLGHVNTP